MIKRVNYEVRAFSDIGLGVMERVNSRRVYRFTDLRVGKRVYEFRVLQIYKLESWSCLSLGILCICFRVALSILYVCCINEG